MKNGARRIISYRNNTAAGLNDIQIFACPENSKFQITKKWLKDGVAGQEMEL
jgi:hypothetical protein